MLSEKMVKNRWSGPIPRGVRASLQSCASPVPAFPHLIKTHLEEIRGNELLGMEWNNQQLFKIYHLPGGGCIIFFTRPTKLAGTGYVCPSVITSTFPLYDI